MEREKNFLKFEERGYEDRSYHFMIFPIPPIPVISKGSSLSFSALVEDDWLEMAPLLCRADAARADRSRSPVFPTSTSVSQSQDHLSQSSFPTQAISGSNAGPKASNPFFPILMLPLFQ
ncbi:hypothetical protein ACLOJK_032860 [Asimina triloba]